LKIIEACIARYNDKYSYGWNDLYKNYPFNKFDFYHEDIEQLWKNDIEIESKNMILYGAPGTGKTYSDNVFGKGDTSFIVDGIDLSLIEEGEEEKKKIVLNIIDSENSFFDNI